jgi:hypothetical protein
MAKTASLSGIDIVAAPTEHRRGRPTLHIDFEKVEALAARGLTMEQIAAAIGFGTATLYRKKRRYRKLRVAIEKGRAAGISLVANKLFSDAVSGNTTAQIFYLKTRAGWRDQPDLALVNLNVLGGSEAEREEMEIARAMTVEERAVYLELTNRARARVKGAIEVESRPVGEGEPTGEEIPLDE